MYNRTDKINITMSRDQLHLIRAAFSSWLDRQENITDEFIQVEELLNSFYPTIQSVRKTAV